VASIADLPLPTKDQREHFADYVAHSHSWYKRFPPYPPGVEFHFFIDISAGRDRKHGTPLVTDRLEQGVHYSAIPTREYRAAFGYLAYSTGWTNKIPLVMPSIGGESALVHGLPDEVFDAGTAMLTGVIHTLSAANIWVWEENRWRGPVDWPQESGGRATLEKILDRCRELRAPGVEVQSKQRSKWPYRRYPSPDIHIDLADEVLLELLAPEQQRQRTEMIRAIDRVCEIIVRHRESERSHANDVLDRGEE
jgi:hypothetical protein